MVISDIENENIGYQRDFLDEVENDTLVVLDGAYQEYASYIECGVSPRASIDLYNASKAVALLRDKEYVTPLDIATVVANVLQHRLILSYKAQAKNITPKDIVQKILEVIKAP